MSFKLLETPLIHLSDGRYCYDTFQKQLSDLASKYSYLISVESIGMTHEHKEVALIRLGKGSRRVHINGAHHGNEWITSIILMKSIAILCEMYEKNMLFYGMTIKRLLDQMVTYDIVPMVNPDGVDLCIKGMAAVSHYDRVLNANEGQMNFSRWKANAMGVDLNRNYDAGFEAYQLVSEKKIPSYAYYSGSRPSSEPESRALVELTNKRLYDMVLAYHTQGQVIYWDYQQIPVPSGRRYAELFSKASGYALDTPDIHGLGCGYKDWFIEKFHKPGYTIECGIGENPIDTIQVEDCIIATIPIILFAAFTK